MVPKGSKKFLGFLEQVSDELVGLVRNNKRDNKRRNNKRSTFVRVSRPRPTKAEKLQNAIMKVGLWLDAMEDNQINPAVEERRAFYENAKPNFSDRKRWIVLIEL